MREPLPGDPAGFTLLEVLIALALTVAVAAVVLPVSMSWLPAAGLEEAPARLETALALARADAQRRGVVLEVVAVVGEDGSVELRSRELEEEETGRSEVGGAAPDELVDAAEETVLGEMPAGIILRRVLPGEVEHEASPLAEDTGGALPDGAEAAAGSDALGEAGTVAQAVVIALALPDGRIVAEDPSMELLAVGPDGKKVRLVINGWTGAVESRVAKTAGADELEEPSEPREDPAEAP